MASTFICPEYLKNGPGNLFRDPADRRRRRKTAFGAYDKRRQAYSPNDIPPVDWGVLPHQGGRQWTRHLPIAFHHPSSQIRRATRRQHARHEGVAHRSGWSFTGQRVAEVDERFGLEECTCLGDFLIAPRRIDGEGRGLI